VKHLQKDVYIQLLSSRLRKQSNIKINKMKKTALLSAGLLASFGFGLFINPLITEQSGTIFRHSAISNSEEKADPIKLGAFSVSLSVKDLKISKQFYENLGFQTFGGGMEKNYLIMKNENSVIGLFQGMFVGNMLTFNPGWDGNAKNTDPFNDVREIQKHLKDNNIKLTMEADEKTSGPAYLMLNDPDGNVILIDQHR
jgi:catechol 2,3-dioxygenase-like lactoylglutathione lyase family enzyme